jgi:hypothetical protein
VPPNQHPQGEAFRVGCVGAEHNLLLGTQSSEECCSSLEFFFLLSVFFFFLGGGAVAVTFPFSSFASSFNFSRPHFNLHSISMIFNSLMSRVTSLPLQLEGRGRSPFSFLVFPSGASFSFFFTPQSNMHSHVCSSFSGLRAADLGYRAFFSLHSPCG